jgi:hypothetical protein
MHTSKLWHSLHISSKQIILLVLFAIASSKCIAQREGYNMMEHDDKKLYFGITMALNNAQYKIFHSNAFLQDDSVLVATPNWNPGFQVGIMSNFRINKHFGLRLIPQFALVYKEMKYKFTDLPDTTLLLESIMLQSPLLLKFNSDRISNFRFYSVAGLKFDYDFNSNINSRRTDEALRIKPLDIGYELGVGFEFYYPNFIFSPEIKVSNGYSNIQKNQPGILTSKAIETLNSKMIILSFTIGG